VYTAPAGSGGSLFNPLGISAFNSKVYVSNTGDNVVSLLLGNTTTTIAGGLEGIGALTAASFITTRARAFRAATW
jgi:hypothetical protein